MSHDSYVSGFIKVESDISQVMEIINRLPATIDHDEWPFLTSNMFSHTSSPKYQDDIIHFAASYKDICGSWGEWELKIQQLLQRFSWETVTIIVEDCYYGYFLLIWEKEGETPDSWKKIEKYVDHNLLKDASPKIP